MQKLLAAILCVFVMQSPGRAQQMDTPQGDTLAKGTFILHKFQKPIGSETYALVKEGALLRKESDFLFNDRGMNGS